MKHCHHCKNGEHEKVTMSDTGLRIERTNDVRLTLIKYKSQGGIVFRGYLCGYHQERYHEDGCAVYWIDT